MYFGSDVGDQGWFAGGGGGTSGGGANRWRAGAQCNECRGGGGNGAGGRGNPGQSNTGGGCGGSERDVNEGGQPGGSGVVIVRYYAECTATSCAGSAGIFTG